MLGLLGFVTVYFNVAALLLLAAAVVNAVDGKDDSDNHDQNGEGDHDTKPCRDKRAVAQHKVGETLLANHHLEVIASASASKNSVCISSALILGACIKRRARNWGTTVLPVALVRGLQLRDTIRDNIIRLAAVHFTLGGVAKAAFRIGAIILAVRIRCAGDMLMLYTLLALLSVAVQALATSIRVLTLITLLQTPAVNAHAIVAKAIHVARVIIVALSANFHSKNAFTTIAACHVHSARVAFSTNATAALRKAVTLILRALLAIVAVLILSATVIEITLNDALLLLRAASENVSAVTGGETISIILTVTIPSVFAALAFDAVERESAAL